MPQAAAQFEDLSHVSLQVWLLPIPPDARVRHRQRLVSTVPPSEAVLHNFICLH